MGPGGGQGLPQGFLPFLSCALLLLAPLRRRLGLLAAKDNLAFLRGSDLPETPFLEGSFRCCFLPAASTGDTGVAPFSWGSFRFFFFSFGVLAGALGLVVVGGSEVRLLVTGVPFTGDWAGTLLLTLFLFFLPVLGGWAPLGAWFPLGTAGLAASSSAEPSNLRFLRFLVSGKNPFFFRFMLMGLGVALGMSLASFFSDLGRLEVSEIKEVFTEGRSDLHPCSPVRSQLPRGPTMRHTQQTVCTVEVFPATPPRCGPSSPNVLDTKDPHGLPVEVVEAAEPSEGLPLRLPVLQV